MGRLKFLFVLFLIALTCCGDDEATESSDYFVTETFVIINRSEHQVLLEDVKQTVCERYELGKNDSILIKKNSDALQNPSPFEGDVFMYFDDEVKYRCNQSTDSYVKDITYSAWYEKECVSKTEIVSRYVITEEDYEYAKAHPYIGE